MSSGHPGYPLLTGTTLRIAVAILSGRKRSLRQDAAALVARLNPPLRIEGQFPDLGEDGWLIATNHYHRPGFHAWWIALAISALLPREVMWLMTSAWTYPDPVRARIITPITAWIFQRLAEIYGLVNMPPMPPRPEQVHARARAIRAVLRYARDHTNPLIGLAPEGADSSTGALSPPPAGAGRFISLLAMRGLQLLPVGIYEQGQQLCIFIGRPQNLPKPDTQTHPSDQRISETVMRAIAQCLPVSLRGPYQ